MRYLLLMLLATVLVCGGCGDDADSNECNLGEYSGDFTISTQSDVTTLAGYTSIEGELRIECPSCTDLSELICLTSLVRRLTISENDALTSLGGLSAITSIYGDCGILYGSLYIYDNPALINLNGLSGISRLNYLDIYENPVLTNLDGLSGITRVDVLRIHESPALTSLDGLSGISRLNWLGIRKNPVLTSLDGLSTLTSVDSLRIHENPTLANLNGLSVLKSVGNELEIYDNIILPDCEACDLLDQLTSTPTAIEVHGNLADTCTPVPANCPEPDAGVDGGP